MRTWGGNLSPVMVYDLGGNSTELAGTCTSIEEPCHVRLEQRWNHERYDGIWNIICPELTGNTCGDHGLSIKVREDSANSTYDDETEICFAGEVHSGVLTSDEVLEWTFWYTEEALFAMKCFFWITEDGHLPRQPAESRMEDDVLQELVSFSVNYEDPIL